MEKTIESHLIEKRVFRPARRFAKNARIGRLEEYRRMYRESIEAPEKFWAREAGAPPGGERAVSGLHPQQDSG